MPRLPRIPRSVPATAALVGLTALGTLLFRTVWPGLLPLVRRDPDALRHGQVWRVLSPVLVQPDPVGVAVTVLVLVALVGAVAERAFGTRRVLVLLLGGALAAHVAGEWWQPRGAGVSVAGCGALGGLALWWLRMRRSGPVSAGGAVLLLGALALGGHDIHGVAILAGVLLGAVVLRDVPATYRGVVRG